jgi:hypothetical protein
VNVSDVLLLGCVRLSFAVTVSGQVSRLFALEAFALPHQGCSLFRGHHVDVHGIGVPPVAVVVVRPLIVASSIAPVAEVALGIEFSFCLIFYSEVCVISDSSVCPIDDCGRDVV